MTVWKYQLMTIDYQEVLMPPGSEVLCVQVQNKIPCLWVRVDDTIRGKIQRIIHIVGTGHSIPIKAKNSNYIGTYQLYDGNLIFHVFDGGELYK